MTTEVQAFEAHCHQLSAFFRGSLSAPIVGADAPEPARALAMYHGQVIHLLSCLNHVDLAGLLDCVVDVSLLADEAFTAALTTLGSEVDPDERLVLIEGLSALKAQVNARRDVALRAREVIGGAISALQVLAHAVANMELGADEPQQSTES